MNCGVALFSSWSKSIRNPKMSIMRSKGPCRLVPPFESEHLEWAWTSRLRSYYTCVATICFSLPITSGDQYHKLKTRISCQELMKFHKWGCREKWLLPCRYIVVNDPCSNGYFRMRDLMFLFHYSFRFLPFICFTLSM